MNSIDKRGPNKWTREEKDRIVGAFKTLLEMDKKQNPELYRKTPMHEKGHCDIVKA